MRNGVFAPFPYTGGKTRIAARVWQELGTDVYSYLEPFCGSAAVLLARPDAPGPRREIIGDLNGFIANAYRSIQADPDLTASFAWWPSVHADLTARHRWLVRWGQEGGLQRLMDDPDYYDPKVAGWWLWGVSNWISVSDFCAAAFAPVGVEAAVVGAVHDKVPAVAQSGVTTNRNTPDYLPRVGLDSCGHGVSAQRVTVDPAPDAGPSRWIPWFRALSARLERVYVLSRPWHIVLGSRTLLGDFKGRTIGVFLDPPYRTTGRQANLYAQDDGDAVFDAAWQWAKDHGNTPNYRIAICGLAGDFGDVPDGWREYRWRNAGGIGGGSSNGKPNEVVLFSPHCLGRRAPQATQCQLGL